MKKVILASRGSRLALAQTEMVRDGLMAANEGLQTDLIIIQTKGDKILDVPLAKVGGKGLFVKEIEEALLDKRADIAVHSLKDVPAELPQGLMLGACLVRETPFDALVSEKYASLRDLPDGAKVGTSSLRRACQLKAIRPDLEILSLRGNVETRLRKLNSEGFDAIVLAAAGLNRLGLEDRITELLVAPDFVPAVGQGIVVVECREDDQEIKDLLLNLEHASTRLAMRAERAFLATMGGGCQVPLGAYAEIKNSKIHMVGMVGHPDGSQIHKEKMVGSLTAPETLGIALANALLDCGGAEILRELTA
ncbi:MAG: hydroxymethylbilane synthase [Myxococcota bacterium]|jgi:hydroxymethylbilane synthase|nr:hydroxymethylbilane synthase [Myxococcota bacterium]HHW95746.1 hydroxymethylbilane synthase [Oligoflexales bacterium]MBP8971291.1 hydroxymethylbilane synthase [Myxococcota bacterium]HPC90930.1 hydroxymethylbilane synthase [Myxococcota bacterium]HQL56080.1 hydroxymethylbilane synthase [Myxococcota bacterium]